MDMCSAWCDAATGQIEDGAGEQRVLVKSDWCADAKARLQSETHGGESISRGRWAAGSDRTGTLELHTRSGRSWRNWQWLR